MEKSTHRKKTFEDYEIQICDQYKLNTRERIGRGAFGDIFLGKHVKTNEKVAIKVERVDTEYPQLFYEAKIYMYLHGGVGIPNLLWCGIQKNYNILIMELLGKSLEDLLNLCQRKFQLKTVLMIADQILKRIEYIHNRNFIIRDMKPQNFLIGLEKEKRNTIYAIDFGIAKRYRDPKTGLHINYKEGCDLMGCARFASINALLGIEQSRRDDIEAFGYMIVYLAKGTLPWIGLRAKNMKEKYRKLKERKIETNLIDLCHGLPDELKIIINYAREIQFEDKPDYNLIKKLIKSAMDRNKIKNDQKFEWNTILEEEDKKNILFLDLKDDEKDNE